MRRDLPPLPALRAFDAAARLGGFAKAAEELCLTPGAVAHQVRQLEQWLGLALFVRRARAVDLTESGRLYQQTVGATLEELERASQQLRRWADDGEVTVTAMPSFVSRWLMPRLGRLRARHPAMEVRVLGSVPVVDFARDRVDVAIRLGTGPYPQLLAEPLLEERFLALASPALLRGHRSASGAAALLRLTLLHDEFEARIPQQIDWPRWFAAHGVSAPRKRLAAGLRFSHTYLTLDAAVAGQGVAVASQVLAGDALAAGQLAIAAGAGVPGPYRYHLLRNPATDSRPQVRNFVDWLRAEARHFDAGAPA